MKIYGVVNAKDFSDGVWASNTYNSVVTEASKGCHKKVFEQPVCLEPSFEKFNSANVYKKGDRVNFGVMSSEQCSTWFVCKLKIPLLDEVDWERFESVISRLSLFQGVISFEVFGNSKKVSFVIGSLSKQLLSVLCGVWQAVFPEIVVMDTEDYFDKLIDVSGMPHIFDMFPPPPYYRKMTCYTASLAGFLRTISKLPEAEFGFYQVLFRPARHNWHFNIKGLVQAENMLGARSPYGKTSAGMIKDLSKPLFAVAVRFGCVSNNNDVVSALSNFCGSFLHAGNPFGCRTEKDFMRCLERDELIEMLSRRVTYCPGIILGSDELCSFVHFPDSRVKNFSVVLDVAKGFRVPAELLEAGRPLGFNYASEKEVLVRLPDSLHNRGSWALGRSRCGKSTGMTNQFCWHVENGDGACLLDPHRVTAKGLLGFLPENAVGRTAFLDFDDDSYVLDYCPFDEDNEEVFGRLSAEIVNSMKNLFEAGSYYRMSHLLGRAVYALFVLKKNLTTIPVLFSRAAEGERLRKEVAARTANAEIRRFWSDEFYTYPKEAFMPIINRFSTLFMDSKAQRIFSREKNKVDVVKFMDEGWAVPVALPSSVDIACIVGGMLAGDFQKASFLRADRGFVKPFYLFMDEFYRIGTPRIIQSLIDECVKGGLHVCLANQETGQLSDELLKAVLSLPNIFVYNVNLVDAKKLFPVFNGKVSVDDIISQDTAEFFANIYGNVVDVVGLKPKKDFNEKVKEMIVSESRKNLYTPLAEVQKKPVRKPKCRQFDSF